MPTPWAVLVFQPKALQQSNLLQLKHILKIWQLFQPLCPMQYSKRRVWTRYGRQNGWVCWLMMLLVFVLWTMKSVRSHNIGFDYSKLATSHSQNSWGLQKTISSSLTIWHTNHYSNQSNTRWHTTITTGKIGFHMHREKKDTLLLSISLTNWVACSRSPGVQGQARYSQDESQHILLLLLPFKSESTRRRGH